MMRYVNGRFVHTDEGESVEDYLKRTKRSEQEARMAKEIVETVKSRKRELIRNYINSLSFRYVFAPTVLVCQLLMLVFGIQDSVAAGVLYLILVVTAPGILWQKESQFVDHLEKEEHNGLSPKTEARNMGIGWIVVTVVLFSIVFAAVWARKELASQKVSDQEIRASLSQEIFQTTGVKKISMTYTAKRVEEKGDPIFFADENGEKVIRIFKMQGFTSNAVVIGSSRVFRPSIFNEDCQEFMESKTFRKVYTPEKLANPLPQKIKCSLELKGNVYTVTDVEVVE